MSQEMLESEHAAKEQKYLQKLEALRDSKRPENEIINFIDANAPTRYTPEDVITRSSALYTFVNSK